MNCPNCKIPLNHSYGFYGTPKWSADGSGVTCSGPCGVHYWCNKCNYFYGIPDEEPVDWPARKLIRPKRVSWFRRLLNWLGFKK